MDKAEERAQKCAYHLGQLAGLGLLKKGEYSLIRNRTIVTHESYIECDKQQLDIPVVMLSFNFLMDALNDRILDADSDEERVALLYSIKVLCLTYGIKRPDWWYKRRNNTDWLDEDGNHHYGYDLGGF